MISIGILLSVFIRKAVVSEKNMTEEELKEYFNREWNK